jgi:coenzyme F420-0:L-glutamate ligase/coenzyme F420-1:gamma-L-glutamate ligase
VTPVPASGSGPDAGLRLFGVTGIGEVLVGDDLATLLVDALTAGHQQLLDGDVLVISSKVISKTEGRTVSADTRDAQIVAETVRPIAARRTPNGVSRIVEAAAGPVMAAAGVDASNVAPGTVLLLPKDPDASARALRARLRELTGTTVGVIVSDTAGRAWRDGQVDFALGAAGVAVTDDLRGAIDTHGQSLEVTVRALVDELAAATDLVKGKLSGVPAAIVRGTPVLVTDEDGPGAATLLRPARTDWFRYGHVEAVRASLGVPDGVVEPPSIPPDDVPTRLARALEVAQHGGPAAEPGLDVGPGSDAGLDAGPGLDAGAAFASRMVLRSQNGTRAELRLTAENPGPFDWLLLGTLAARLRAAAWSEDLAVHLTVSSDPSPSLQIAATEAVFD